MKRQDNAVKYFNEGYNCAQSVVLSFQDVLAADNETIVNIASGFGGGMGRLQKTCGALTGSFMVISLYNSENIGDESERKDRTNKLIQDLEHDFVSNFGFSDCSPLTGVDLKTEEGRDELAEVQRETKICERSISACVSWLNKHLINN